MRFGVLKSRAVKSPLSLSPLKMISCGLSFCKMQSTYLIECVTSVCISNDRFFFPWQGESMDTKLSFENIAQLAGVNPAISGASFRDGREGEMKELVWEPAMITVPLSG